MWDISIAGEIIPVQGGDLSLAGKLDDPGSLCLSRTICCSVPIGMLPDEGGDCEGRAALVRGHVITLIHRARSADHANLVPLFLL